MTYQDKFVQRLKDLRKERGLSQRKLAKRTYSTQCGVSKWERGECAPNFDIIIQLALFFNVSADYLLGLTDERR